MIERTIEYIQDDEKATLHIIERLAEYYDDDKKHLKEISLIVDNQFSGDHRGYWPNGSIKFRHHYTHGVFHGAYYEYDENGKIITRLFYCNGELSNSPNANKPITIKTINQYGLQEMLEWLKHAKKPFDYLPGGFKVHTNSNRLKLFRQTQTCVACGIRGDHFQLNWTKNDVIPHLNMYATKNGASILMTRDHIEPKSLGGGNGLANSQVMCCHCNSKKGNKRDHELAQGFWKVKAS